jgi:hypothetical protein
MPEEKPNELPQADQPESAGQSRRLDLAIEHAMSVVYGKATVVKTNVSRTLDTLVAIVEDPAAAPRFSMRHNDRLIVDRLIELLTAYIAGGNSPAVFHEIDGVLRSHVKENGFFVERYSDEKLRDRLAGTYPNGEKKYLMVETSVSHLRAGAQGASTDPYADVQIALPTTADGAEHVMDMPVEGDDIVNRDLVEEMYDMPYAVASLDDMVCDPAMARQHLVTTALRKALHEIRTSINPDRGARKIRYMTACLASIRGIRFKDGTVWNLQEDGRISPIFNERSAEVFEHMRKDVPPFRTAFVLRDREVLIDHPLVEAIIVDWHTKVAELKD